MRRYGRGDVSAFDVLYARHKDAVYRYCRRQLPAATADDVHQEIWLAIIRARKSYQPRAEFRAWLFTIAHNTLLNRVRAEAKHPSGQDDGQDQPAGDAPHRESEREDERERLHAAISALPHHQRDALLLKHEGGFSIEDIAAITATTREGVRSRLRYAMGRLRERMNRNEPEPQVQRSL